MQHPRKPDVNGVVGASGGAERPVLAWRGLADGGELSVLGPLLELVFLVDECPDLRHPAFHLRRGANELLCHDALPAARRIARSMLGYAPQRQMLPAIAEWICSRVGAGVDASNAVAATI